MSSSRQVVARFADHGFSGWDHCLSTFVTSNGILHGDVNRSLSRLPMFAPTLVAKNVFFRWWSRLRGQLLTLPISMCLGGALVWAAIPKGTVVMRIRILGIRAFFG